MSEVNESRVTEQIKPPLDLQDYVDDLLNEDARDTTESPSKLRKQECKELLQKFDDPISNGQSKVLLSPSLLQIETEERPAKDTEKEKSTSQSRRLDGLNSKQFSTARPQQSATVGDLNEKAPIAINDRPERQRKRVVAKRTITDGWDAGVLSSRFNAEQKTESQTNNARNSLEWLDNGRPGWAQQRFDCLFFDVGNLAIAMPLVTLGSVHFMKDNMRCVAGSNEFLLGITPINGTSYKVIDTAQLVCSDKSNDDSERSYKYIIAIDATDFSLAVNDIKRSAPIEPTSVKWRSNRSKRRWLAGIAKEQMCVILDAAELKRLFSSSPSS